MVHYKWRGMRANGIEEHYITGDASLFNRFEKWAETVPYTLRNPLFHWTQLEIKRYFDIDAVLQPERVEVIYNKANSVLENKTPVQLMEMMNVEVVSTTDDPSDDLKYHQEIAAKGFYTKVYPTFRHDNLFFIGKPSFTKYLEQLGVSENTEIRTCPQLEEILAKWVEYFHSYGCRLSDF